MSSGTSSAPARKRAGIIQSNYIPWKGYFDFIASVDEFVVFDDVQYTRRDWRNRNRIKTKDGLKWLTVPVEAKGHYSESVSAIRVAGHRWVDEHLASLRHAYGRAPFFGQEWPWIERSYESCRSLELLSEINISLIAAICGRLRIRTPIRRSSEFEAVPGKNERLISLCKQLCATEYLSGPAARGYVDEQLWQRSNIRVYYKSYAGYPEYSQVHGPFEHGTTVLDVLFHTGPDAERYIRSARDVEPAV